MKKVCLFWATFLSSPSCTQSMRNKRIKRRRKKKIMKKHMCMLLRNVGKKLEIFLPPTVVFQRETEEKKSSSCPKISLYLISIPLCNTSSCVIIIFPNSLHLKCVSIIFLQQKYIEKWQERIRIYGEKCLMLPLLRFIGNNLEIFFVCLIFRLELWLFLNVETNDMKSDKSIADFVDYKWAERHLAQRRKKSVVKELKMTHKNSVKTKLWIMKFDTLLNIL